MENSKLSAEISVESVDNILLTTAHQDGGYVAQCIVSKQSLITAPKDTPHMAINHLINVVVAQKKEKGHVRGFHYIFWSKL